MYRTGAILRRLRIAERSWLSSEPDRLDHQPDRRQLMSAAEAEAVTRRCRVVRVDTHTFQTPGFYEKLGYQRIGFAPDTPVGHGEVFFLKRLPSGAG
jgi:hypothetical protein